MGNNAGIDYGMGKTNIDVKTGIRYGVIAMNSLSGDASESLEYDYPFNCPKCGRESLVKSRSAEYDYFCQSCRTWHMSEDCYGEESIGFHLDDGEYKLVDCLDTDVMVISSPYFTYAKYCSPCVPGAGDLNNPDAEGVKTYCLGPDWFDEFNPCEYPIYSVKTEQLYLSAAAV